MPINIIQYGTDSVTAEYIAKNGVKHELPEIKGKFKTKKQARLAVVDECLKLGLINSAQHMVYRRHIINPATPEFYKEFSKKGVDTQKKNKDNKV